MKSIDSRNPLLAPKPPLFKRRGVIFFVVAFVTVFGIAATLRSHAATSPALGIYHWDAGSTAADHGPGGVDMVDAWLGGNKVTLAEAFTAHYDWTAIEGPSWQLGPWSTWVAAKPGRTLIYSVEPFPSGISGSLDACSAGTYNAHYVRLSQNLVANKLSTSQIRFAWEQNGNWFPWAAAGHEAAYVGCFQQFVKSMRSVTGSSFKYVWNPNIGPGATPSENTYPGDTYVDLIGPDSYDSSWIADTYPYPSICDNMCRLNRQKTVWNYTLTGNHGLNWFSTFAKSHGKQLVIPEWGIDDRPDGHGGLDDAYYIQQMHDFIMNPLNNVAWHVYFDVNATDGKHQVSPVPASYVSAYPQASALFKNLFSTVATPTPTASSTATTDTTAPTVSLINPSVGSAVSGLVPVQATAADAGGINRVEFYLDGALVKSEAAAPYCMAGDLNGICNGWDSKTVLNGSHTLVAKAYDQAANVSATASLAFTVSNAVTAVTTSPTPVADSVAPTATFTSPQGSSNVAVTSVNGIVALTASAVDNVEVVKIEIYVDGRMFATGFSNLVSTSWNTRTKKVSVGNHILTTKAYDAAGNVGSAVMSVNVTK